MSRLHSGTFATAGAALAWLESAQRFGIKLGLENTTRLLAATGDPHHMVPCLHVAGTNGKGSVCAMTAACLREAGLRVGLYTSPHLVRFAERVRVDGEPIDDAAIANGLGRLREASGGWKHRPTFFELATVLAFDHFARSACDVTVIETGMGGRLDATNTVSPRVAVLTPIDIDHAAWLGTTIAAIAGEKAGIIKPGAPVVCAPQHPDAADVIAARARDVGSPLVTVEAPWPGEIGLAGTYQRWNAAVAVAAIRASGFPVADEAVRRGLVGVAWPGRFQRVGGRWVLDGAHNPHAASALAALWRETFGAVTAPVVFACLADKDAGAIARALAPMASAFHLPPLASERAMSPDKLAAFCPAPCHVHRSLGEALDAAQGSPALVTGSLFLVGEVLEALGISP